ncbi:hypothetical protein BDV27DRAFT_156594 [Aspergillus caelatus]|uniref:Uncharacterized protein n=1 Tax=Aspergillus caelatus TaxID=61420 RepID=A0A5N7A792_9EURO|nr:uncharacterized protein BDV27DRAFT_156594 [Aspergillus caelatus]KAE8365711.1 hypothetical protein BDV27DRAFT_156594 [Aspergillus caelatus]
MNTTTTTPTPGSPLDTSNPLTTGTPRGDHIHPGWYLGSSALGLLAIVLIGVSISWSRICIMRAKQRYPAAGFTPTNIDDAERLMLLNRRPPRRKWWQVVGENLCCCCVKPSEKDMNYCLRLLEEGRMKQHEARNASQTPANAPQEAPSTTPPSPSNASQVSGNASAPSNASQVPGNAPPGSPAVPLASGSAGSPTIARTTRERWKRWSKKGIKAMFG